LNGHRVPQTKFWTESPRTEGRGGTLEIQFALIVNWIQMKFGRVIDTTKNLKSQQFQHCVELQLIEGIHMNMHRIQFELIVNEIQMKLTRVMYTTKNLMNQ
jgi:hypothetical protein